MRPGAALRRAFHPDRRWSTLAQALACVFCFLLVYQQYQENQRQQEQPRLQKAPSGAAATAAADADHHEQMTTAALPQGPKHACVSDEWMVWEEYRECVEATGGALGGSFDDYLRKTYGSDAPDAQPPRPWGHPPASGVIVEFRPNERLLKFAISNAMDNLPVAWRFYVASNAAVRAVVEKHFGAEVAVGKIRFIKLEHANVAQHEVSHILSAKSLYDQMDGDYWLFFQTDSAICRAQRHLIKPVLESEYGWWGAPWASHIIAMTPYFGGNGGFALRSRAMMTPILEQSPMGTGGSEDGYFMSQAAGLVQSGRTANPPAPYYDELWYSVETMMHTRPFAVHAPWKDFMPSWEFRALVENCPEVLNIMPEGYGICDKFGPVFCAADIDRAKFVVNKTTACDWATMCSAPVEDKHKVFVESLSYVVT